MSSSIIDTSRPRTPPSPLTSVATPSIDRVQTASFLRHLGRFNAPTSLNLDELTQPTAAASVHTAEAENSPIKAAEGEAAAETDETQPDETSDAVDEAAEDESPDTADDEADPDNVSEEAVAAEHVSNTVPLTVRMLNSLLLTGQAPQPIVQRQIEAASSASQSGDASAHSSSDASDEHAAQTTELSRGFAQSIERRAFSGAEPAAQAEHRPVSTPALSPSYPSAIDRAAADPSSSRPEAAAPSTPTTDTHIAAAANASQATAVSATALNAQNPATQKSTLETPSPTASTVQSLAADKPTAKNGSQNPSNAGKDPGAFLNRSSATSAASRAESADAALTAQVTRGVIAAANQRDGNITIRLAPEHLGPLRLQVRLKDGAIAARFEASTDSARDLLSKSLDSLRTTLEDRGYVVESLNVHAAEPRHSPSIFDPLRQQHERSNPDGGGSSEHGRSSDNPSHDPRGDHRPDHEQHDLGAGRADDTHTRLGDAADATNRQWGGWGLGNGVPNPAAEWSRVQFNIPIAHTAEPRAQSIDAIA